MDRGVVRYLHLEFKLPSSIFGDGSTEDSSAVAHHEVDLLRSHLFGSDDEVTFILSVFVVDDDEELPLTEVFEGFLDRVQLNLTHSVYMYLSCLGVRRACSPRNCLRVMGK